MLGSKKHIILQNIDCTHSNWMVYILSVTLRMEATKTQFGSGNILSAAIFPRILSSKNNIFGNPARILSFSPSLYIIVVQFEIASWYGTCSSEALEQEPVK